MTDLKNIYTLHLQKHKKRKANIEECEYNLIHREIMEGCSYLARYLQWTPSRGLEKTFSLQITKCHTIVRGRQPVFPATAWYSFYRWHMFRSLTWTYTHIYTCTQMAPGLADTPTPRKKALHSLLSQGMPKPDGDMPKSTTRCFIETCCWSWAGVRCTVKGIRGLFSPLGNYQGGWSHGGEILFWEQLKNIKTFPHFLPA